jgi:hypothetical protein
MATDKNTVRIENKTAHIKHIAIGNGQIITVPPVDGGGVEVHFDSDGERSAFQRALETPQVKKWIEAGELVIGGSSGNFSRTAPTQPTQPIAQPSAAPPSNERYAAEPAQVTTRKTNRE